VSEPPDRTERTLAVADQVAALLAEQGTASALIGAAALAIHNYPRETQDLDLAVDVGSLDVLRRLADMIGAAGFESVLSEPDGEDPLGGVITVRGESFDDIQIINFHNPIAPRRNPGAAAVRVAQSGVLAGTRLRVVDIPHLVALKLYAGGRQSQLDVLELIERNPDADWDQVERVCNDYGLGGAFRELRDG
jgi:hypothetical protein